MAITMATAGHNGMSSQAARPTFDSGGEQWNGSISGNDRGSVNVLGEKSIVRQWRASPLLAALAESDIKERGCLCDCIEEFAM